MKYQLGAAILELLSYLSLVLALWGFAACFVNYGISACSQDTTRISRANRAIRQNARMFILGIALMILCMVIFAFTMQIDPSTQWHYR